MSRRVVPALEPALESHGVVDVLTGRELLVAPMPAGPLSVEDARYLTDRIRDAARDIGDRLARLRQLVDQARDGDAWAALQYPSWTAYLSDVLEPMRLPRDERREIVGYLTGQGMSSRAIAPIVSADQKTVVNDRSAIQAAAVRAQVRKIPQVAPITGLDGKEYSTAAARPKLVIVPPPSDDADAPRDALRVPTHGLPVFVGYLRTRIATTGVATADDWKNALTAAERYAAAPRRTDHPGV